MAASLLQIAGSREFLSPVFLSLRVLLFVLPTLALVGIPLGVFLGRSTGWFSSVLDFFLSLPLIFPPIATGFLLLLLLGRQSLLGGFLYRNLGVSLVFSYAGVAFAGFISGLPLLVKTIQGAVRREIQGHIEAAYMLGKSRGITFFQVVLPLLKRGIVTGMFLAVARAMGDVGITLMLGGNILGRTNTLALEIYNSVFVGDFTRASMLACLLGILSLIVTKITRARTWEE